MDELDDSTTKSDKSLKNFSVTAGDVGKVAKIASAAILAAGTALSTMIIATAMSRRELELFSRQAKLSVEDFNALSFATKQYGINAEQIADISKDISDKLGEFGKAGTGPFQDFADVIGITTEEAQVLAIQMQELSGRDAIGLMVSRMEDAGASANEMTFALESMGNDLSRLIPLFSNNGKELTSLEESYKSANKELEITKEQAKELEEAAKNFDLAMATLGNAATNIAANVAEPVNKFFKGLILSVPEATRAINDFLDNLDSPTRKNHGTIARGTIQRDEDGNVIGSTDTTDVVAEIEKEEDEKVAVVRSSEDILAEVRANARQLEADARAEANATALEAIQDRFKTEEQLLAEKLEKELEIVGENQELRKELEAEYQQALADIKIEALEEVAEAEEKVRRDEEREAKKQEREEKKIADNKVKIGQSILGAAKSLNTDLLEDNKAIGAGIIVADTAMGIQKAFAQLGAWGGPAAAAIAVSGATQLANLEGASRGGGSTGTTGAIPTSIPEQDQEEVLLSQSDSSGSNQSVIIRFEGNGDEVTEAIARNMTVLQRNGTLEA